MGRLSANEVIEEYEWLTEQGVHPLQACEQLGKKPAAMSKFLQRNALYLWLEFDRAWKGSGEGRW